MDFLSESFQHPSTLWMILGVVLLILEFIVPGLLLLFFGVGAILTAVIRLWIPIDINAQILVFMISSVVLLVTLRKLLKPLMSGGMLGQVPDVDTYNGLSARVTVAIDPPRPGKVEFNGSEWSARAAHPSSADTQVTIVHRDNLTLVVTPATR